MPELNVVVRCLPAFLMIGNNFSILELIYLPIHNPYLLFLAHRHSQPEKFDIIIIFYLVPSKKKH